MSTDEIKRSVRNSCLTYILVMAAILLDIAIKTYEVLP